MGKIIIALLIGAFLLAAYSTKPDDKTCMIEAAKAVWGNRMPTEERPEYFNQFMDVTSELIEIKDWVFLKQINYKFAKEKRTVAYGAFRRVFSMVKVPK
jgi:hypothetical protein